MPPVPNTPKALCRLIAEPRSFPDAAAQDWEPAIALARQARLLGSLAGRLEAADCLGGLATAPRRQLLSALSQAEHDAGQIGWTLRGIRRALGAEARVVLLKGAAYWAEGIPRMRGRMVGDIDLLVPRAALERHATRLAEHGWRTAVQSAYDQRYYHEWSHEWPPLQKPAGGLEIDLHWHIVPPVGRPYFAADALWDRVRPVGDGRWLVLDAADQVLHAAVHLIQHTGLCNRLRDVHDIDALLRHWSARRAGFGQRLAERAESLGLTRPIWYALALARRWFGTPLPPALAQASEGWRPPAPVRLAMDALLTFTVPPAPIDREGRWDREAAASLLLLRHHWMRMHAPLLMRHLAHKTLLRLRPQPAPRTRAAAPR